jgi:hypothetical protein
MCNLLLLMFCVQPGQIFRHCRGAPGNLHAQTDVPAQADNFPGQFCTLRTDGFCGGRIVPVSCPPQDIVQLLTLLQAVLQGFLAVIAVAVVAAAVVVVLIIKKKK